MNKNTRTIRRPWFTPFVGLLLVVTLLLGQACAGPEIQEVASDERKAAPSFDLGTVAGGTLGTKDIAGKVVLLDFWATWCAPCHLQAEILDSVYEELRESGVGQDDFEIFSVDTNEEAKRVTAFLEKNPTSYPVLLDLEGTVSDAFEVMALPTVVLLDRQGRIAFTATGVTEAKELRPRILEELGKSGEAAG